MSGRRGVTSKISWRRVCIFLSKCEESVNHDMRPSEPETEAAALQFQGKLPTQQLCGCGRSSGVEHNLAKVGVEGSNPFARSIKSSTYGEDPTSAQRRSYQIATTSGEIGLSRSQRANQRDECSQISHGMCIVSHGTRYESDAVVPHFMQMRIGACPNRDTMQNRCAEREDVGLLRRLALQNATFDIYSQWPYGP